MENWSPVQVTETPFKKTGPPYKKTGSFSKETGEDLFLDFWQIEVKNHNTANMLSLIVCPRVDVRL